ncbi:MAG TPA: hypothetical protein VHA75_16015 [Rugosimonospora sp.]|nr:hypothetical protein [Rugosimonospora sp.]
MKLLFWRKPRLPAADRPPLERDERVVAWARAAGGQVVVVTNKGLWLPAREPGSAGDRRLGWHEIHKAAWSERELVITPSAVVADLEGYKVTADLPPVALTLPEPGDVPAQVRARVTRSVAYSTRHALPGQGAARVVARRWPGVDGLHWAVRLEGGADIDDPVVREVTKDLVDAAVADVNR